jgi:hypothetical protein
MATMDREGEGLAHEPALGGQEAPGDYEAFRRAVFELACGMEEPLREASQFARVIGITDTQNDEDREALATVAFEAVARLETAADCWAKLFELCRGPAGGSEAP